MPTAFSRSHPRLVPMNTQSGYFAIPQAWFSTGQMWKFSMVLLVCGAVSIRMDSVASGSIDKKICLDRKMFHCLNRCMLATLQIVQSPEKAGVLLQPGRLRLLEQLTEPDSAAGLARRLGVPRP